MLFCAALSLPISAVVKQLKASRFIFLAIYISFAVLFAKATFADIVHRQQVHLKDQQAILDLVDLASSQVHQNWLLCLPPDFSEQRGILVSFNRVRDSNYSNLRGRDGDFAPYYLDRRFSSVFGTSGTFKLIRGSCDLKCSELSIREKLAGGWIEVCSQ